MGMRFCRDCVNFEDRRDIDSIALCGLNAGPYVCCEEFLPKNPSMNESKLYRRFCSECANFEEVDRTSVCARNHTPGVACGQFINRFERLHVIRQNSQMRVALVAHAINSHSNQQIMPETLIEIGRKIRW